MRYDTYDFLRQSLPIVFGVCRYSVNHFWANAYIQYEFIVANGRTTTFAFHKVV